MLKFKYLLIVLFITVLSGCAATAPQLDTNYQGADAGKVFASISTERTAYSVMSILVRSRTVTQEATNTPTAALQYSLSFSKSPDFHIGYEHGDVSILTLAPGDYEVFGFKMIQSGLVTVSASSDTLKPVPFTVRSGETHYLGGYRITVKNNSFGLPSPFLPKIWIRDKLERDLPIARNKEPGMPSVVQKIVPSAAAFENLVFVDQP
jgi:hypothetical protein